MIRKATFHSRLFCVDINLQAEAKFLVPSEHSERAIQVVSGDIEAGDVILALQQMKILKPDVPVRVVAREQFRLLLFGGELLHGRRFIWPNFVAATQDRIVRASDDSEKGRFNEVPHATEFIPLPEP